MTQKTISLPDDVYMKLRDLKRENESFSELILRLMNKETDKGKNIEIENFFGAFEDESDEWEDIEKKIYSARNKSRMHEPLKLDS